MTKLDPLFNFSTAEIKLLVLLCYFVLLFMTSLILLAVAGSNYYDEVTSFFHCGNSPNGSCGAAQSSSTATVIIGLVFNVTTPSMFLLFVVNVKELKDIAKRRCMSIN